MAENRRSLAAMAIATLGLLGLDALRASGGSPVAVILVPAALAATLGLVLLWVARAPDARSALAGLALANGVLSLAGAALPLILPALAGAAYQSQSDWLSGLDLTPPAIRWLRVALASGYFALALLLAGLAFLAAAYLLFRGGPGRQRHAH